MKETEHSTHAAKTGPNTLARRPYGLWVAALTSLATAVVALIVARDARQQLSNMRSELVVRDAAGRARVRLAAEASGGSVELLDEQGRHRLSIRQVAADEVVLSMHQGESRDLANAALELHIFPGRSYMKMLDGAGGAAILEGNGALHVRSSRAEASFGADKIFGAHLSLFAMREGLRENTFELKVGDRSTISGAGSFWTLHDGFLRDLAWRLKNTRAEP